MFSWVQDVNPRMVTSTSTATVSNNEQESNDTNEENSGNNGNKSIKSGQSNKRLATVNGRITSSLSTSSSSHGTINHNHNDSGHVNPDIIINEDRNNDSRNSNGRSLRRNPMYLPGSSTIVSNNSSSANNIHPDSLRANMIKSGLYPVNGDGRSERRKSRGMTLLGLACRVIFSFSMVAVPILVLFYFIYYEPINNLMGNYYYPKTSSSEQRSTIDLLSRDHSQNSNNLNDENSLLYKVDPSSTAVYVRTKSGRIQGERVQILSKSLDVFLGIPYAEAPIGELRFKKPRSVKPWNGIYRAARFARPCLQYKFDHRSKETPWISSITSSEDCLYLNIWSTGHNGKQNGGSSNSYQRLKPVLIWIHGGGYTTGSADVDNYDGAVLAAFGDMIVVTINYRLGIFGFLNVKHESAPGNQGLFDQSLAIKWISENIEAFGGDPNMITLAGQGSGANCVGFHLISPITRKLFHRAIMMSGSGLAPQSVLEDISMAVDRGQQFALKVSCANERINIYRNPEDVVNCLRKLEGNFLARTADEMVAGFNTPFAPTIGSEFLPINPYDHMKLFQEIGNHAKDVLIGSNRDEGSFFLHLTYPKIFTSNNPKKVSTSQAVPLIEEAFKFIPPPGVQLISHVFLTNTTSSTADAAVVRYKMYEMIGDFVVTCPSVFFSEQLSAMNYSVYHYLFTHRPSSSKWGKWMGVTHYDETPFMFGIPFLKSAEFTEDERQFSARIMDSFSSFIRYGKPLAQLGQEWPKFTIEDGKRSYITLDPYFNGVDTGGPHEANCNIWRRFMFRPN